MIQSTPLYVFAWRIVYILHFFAIWLRQRHRWTIVQYASFVSLSFPSLDYMLSRLWVSPPLNVVVDFLFDASGQTRVPFLLVWTLDSDLAIFFDRH